MICEICHKNETDSTSGICWECSQKKFIMSQEKEIKEKNWENKLFEYDGMWHKKGKDGNCEPFTMADLKDLIAQEKKKWVEEINKLFIKWASEIPYPDPITQQEEIEKTLLKVGQRMIK